MAIRGGFTNSGRTKRVKNKGEGERLIQSNAESQETARRDKEAFFNEQCLIIEENNKRGKTRDLFRKTGNISCKDGLDKGQIWYGPNRSRRY